MNESNDEPMIRPRLKVHLSNASDMLERFPLETLSTSSMKPERLVLNYKLQPTPFVKSWLALVQKDLQIEKRPIWFGGVFYGRLFSVNNGDHLAKKIHLLLEKLEVPGGKLFRPHRNVFLDSRTLDRLHELKTEITRMANTPGFLFPGEYVIGLDLLNFLIHRLETTQTQPAKFGTVVGVPIPPTVRPLEDSDFAHFSLESKFGSIYLDYATNGINIVDCFLHGNKQAPTLQTTMTSGFMLYFGEDRSFNKEALFLEWLRTEHPGIFHQEKKALGKGLLGQLELSAAEKPFLLQRLERMSTIESVEIVQD